MAYTTRGGVSGYTVRSTSPCFADRGVAWASVRCVMAGNTTLQFGERLVLGKLLKNGGSSVHRRCEQWFPPEQSSGRLAILA